MKPLHSILPVALMCGLLSVSMVQAAQPDGVLLAQAGDKDDKDGKDNKNRKNKNENKDDKDRGKGGSDKGREGKGQDKGREDKGQNRGGDRGSNEKKGERPPEKKRDNGPPKVESPPKFTPPKTDEKKGSSAGSSQDKGDRKVFDRDRSNRKGGNDDGGADKKGPPKTETKGSDQNGPPSGSKDAGRKDDNNKDRGQKDTDKKDNNGKDRDRKDNDRKDADRKDDGKNRDWKKDADRGRPERGRWSGGKPAAPSEARDVKDLKAKRKEHSEDGGKRVVIEEPDKRRIIREGGRTIIRHDETERFRRIAPNTRRERRNGLDISVTLLPGGIQIFTDLDNEGRTLRRYRRDRDGRDIVLFDNRDYYRRSRGGSFLDAIIDLPPPRLRIPRERYIVEYDGASDEDIYDTLDAGPVDDLDRGYSLEEVRRSPMLRDRMRRIDLDTVNFEFGSWTVEDSQYGALERVARAMNRIIDRNPGEMFLIEGHTDAVGSDDDNLSLSDRRAESVAIILTEEFGVPPENLTTQGYGEQYLKVPTDGPERLNRRVAVRKITPLLAR